MLFDMLWHQHGDEHIHVLLNFAQTQRELHQAESFLLENKDWQKGLEPWGAIWQIQNQSVLIGYLEKLIEKGQQDAKNLPFLADCHIWKIVKTLSIKAPGLDGLGFDFIRSLPREAMKDLRGMFQIIEEQAMIPSQWKTSLIAMLPKNSSIERPIALVATMYRLWCRLRSDQIKAWARNI